MTTITTELLKTARSRFTSYWEREKKKGSRRKKITSLVRPGQKPRGDLQPRQRRCEESEVRKEMVSTPCTSRTTWFPVAIMITTVRSSHRGPNCQLNSITSNNRWRIYLRRGIKQWVGGAKAKRRKTWMEGCVFIEVMRERELLLMMRMTGACSCITEPVGDDESPFMGVRIFHVYYQFYL